MNKAIIAMAMVISFGALAQAGVEGKLEVGAGLYNSMPMSSDFKDAAKSSLGFNLYGDYKINDMFTAGLELSNAFGYESKMSSTYDLTSMMIGVRGKYVKSMDFGSKKGKVYGILGLANYSFDTDPSATWEESAIGFSIGGGVDVEVAANILAGFELRYHMVTVDDGAGGDFSAGNLAPMLKIGYFF